MKLRDLIHVGTSLHSAEGSRDVLQLYVVEGWRGIELRGGHAWLGDLPSLELDDTTHVRAQIMIVEPSGGAITNVLPQQRAHRFHLLAGTSRIVHYPREEQGKVLHQGDPPVELLMGDTIEAREGGFCVLLFILAA